MSEPEAPTVYLSTNGHGRNGQRVEQMLMTPAEPTVYLAHAPGRIRQQGDSALRDTSEPIVYLAHAPGAPCDNAVMTPDPESARQCGNTGKVVSDELRPPLLLSYAYVKKFIEEQHRYRYRHWILDSGAFTVWKSGGTISLDEYTTFCKERLAADPTLHEVFALDVIGDWRESVRNTERMWAAGVPAIPTYHKGEPEDVLRGYARDYPKIAIGGMALLRGAEKKKFAEQCFARVWPKPVHGLGVGSKAGVMAVPWHSVDATNWEIGPCKYGSWKGYGQGQRRLSVRGSAHDLRVEIKYYAEMEALARHRWRREMVTVAEMLRAANWRGYEGPAVHLAIQGQNGTRGGLTNDGDVRS